MKKKASASTLQPLWETEARAGPKLAARAQLLQAAATAFMARGYSSTKLDDVAAIMGMTKGQIYHYYRSKIDLYFDVVVGAFFMLNAEVRPIAERTDIDAKERLRRMAYEHMMVMMATFPFQKVALEATQHRLQVNSSLRQHRAMERMLQLRSEYEALVNATIQEGQNAGVFEVSSVSLATKAMLGALNWLTVWYDPKRSTSDADRIRIAERSADFVVEGLRPVDFSLNGFADAARASSPSLNFRRS